MVPIIPALVKPIVENQEANDNAKAKAECEAKGGTWNEETKTCKLPTKKEEPQERQQPLEKTPSQTELLRQGGEVKGLTLADGRTFGGLSQQEIDIVIQREREKATRFEGTQEGGTALTQAKQLAEGQELAGQVGQFGELSVSATGLDTSEALTSGVIDSIPSAIRLAAQAGVGAAAIGAIATAPVGGIGAIPAAAIGASAGFIAGIVGGMTSSFKAQRRDTTSAQQRVLDEGKQTMKDWSTLARNDPANKEFYLGEYNKQSAQIDQAYRQMKLDTSLDVAKFETALPNLAEFESFYSLGGERDSLDIEMENSLLAVSPENYNMLELAERRGAFK